MLYLNVRLYTYHDSTSCCVSI